MTVKIEGWITSSTYRVSADDLYYWVLSVDLLLILDFFKTNIKQYKIFDFILSYLILEFAFVDHV